MFLQTLLAICTLAVVSSEEVCVLEKLLTADRLLCQVSDCLPAVPGKKISECDAGLLYRTADGSCNNLKHPEWGVTGGPYLRILLPRYANNSKGLPIELPIAQNGGSLPKPRVLSTTIYPDVDSPWTGYTLLVMQWNQILAHDIGLAPDAVDSSVDCCAEASRPECYPIEIPEDDPFYSQFHVTCLNMARTKAVPSNCLDIPYQLNDASHPIDGSFLYGSDEKTMKSLRLNEGGLLITSEYQNREFPKRSDNPMADCGTTDPSIVCFQSGDFRVNQNPPLTSLQTVLTREHNRIARALAEMNQNWDDEKLFQESKKILTAVYQHITYKDLLPLILGKSYMEKYGLLPLKEGFTSYRDDVNLATFISFTSGSYRVFHTQIQGLLVMYNETRCPFRAINISDYMMRPGIILENSNYDSFLLELVIEYTQKTNRFMTTQMSDLMAKGDLPYGKDLVSMDIQRGRDHGVPNYNTIRQLCGLPEAKKFSDFSDVMNEKNIELLEKTHEHVNDVDYYVGTILEEWVPDGSVGPTTLYILGEQLLRKKVGDRFWYEVGNQPHSFTPDQLQEIKKSSLSRLFCDNGDNIHTIQPNSFLSDSVPENPLTPCSEIPSLDLSKWQE